MKKEWVYLSICLLFLSGCSLPNKDHLHNTVKLESTSLSGENIHAVQLGSKESDVIQSLGKPSKVAVTEKPPAKYLQYDSDKKRKNLEFGIINNKVEGYYFSNNHFKTQKGITIGSTRDQVIKAYGKHYFERTDTGGKVLGYIDKKQGTSLEFTLHKGKVIRVQFHRGMDLTHQKKVGSV